jgi:hypothetical protein
MRNSLYNKELAIFSHMFFKPINIIFIAASSFGNDWRCFLIF